MDYSDTDMDVNYKIYNELYEDPFISEQNLAACTGIPESDISHYVKTLYESTILFGPLIFLKPAQNCHEYTYFLLLDYPLTVYTRLSKKPHIINRTACAGPWNLLVITDVEMDFSVLKEFKRCTQKGLKGRTCLSRVTTRDWDTSINAIKAAVHPPETPSTLYEEIPSLPWGEKEWTLYHKFKSNIRADPDPVLASCNISHQFYQKWLLTLPEVAVIQPAFYPYGSNTCSALQFLFKSQYHRHLSSILGMLPQTIVFFSTGDYLLVQIHVGTEKEVNDVFSIIFQLKDTYFTSFIHSVVIGGSSRKRQQK